MKYKSLIITITSGLFVLLVLAAPSFAQTGAETVVSGGASTLGGILALTI